LNRSILITFLVIFLCGHYLPAQVQDTVAVPKDSLSVSADSLQRSKALKKKIYSVPRRATLMSALLPGLGQVYNRKAWKVPIIYAGLGGFGYMFIVNNNEYRYYRKNLIAVYDEDPTTVNTSGYSGDQLRLLKVQYRRYRDIGIIGMSLIYIFNIIDANVDGHLKTFDVSDDLSLHIDAWHTRYPDAVGFRTATGFTLKLNFN
jgi:hypothetical protein